MRSAKLDLPKPYNIVHRVEVRGWNSYDSDRDKQLPFHWRIVVGGSLGEAEWFVFRPDQVLKVIESTVENVSEYKAWREETRSGIIEIDDDLYQYLRDKQKARGYIGAYLLGD